MTEVEVEGFPQVPALKFFTFVCFDTLPKGRAGRESKSNT